MNDPLSHSRKLLAVLVLALGAVLCSAAVAAAATFNGQSSRDLPVRLNTDDVAQTPTKFVIAWKTNKCKLPGNSFSSSTRFKGFKVATTERLRSKGKYVIEQPREKLRSVVRVKVAGERVSATRWNGTFSAKVRIKRRGKPYERCVQPRVRWTAALSEARKAEPALGVAAAEGLRLQP